jgi:DNA-binding MurR/RpiR family transcriptional regulator
VDELVTPDQFAGLTPRQRTLARYIAANPAIAAFASVSEVAEKAGVTPPTAVRFAQALGFRGYGEFRQNIRHRYLGRLRPEEVLRSQSEAHHDHDLIANVFDQDIANLRTAMQTADFALIRRVAHRIHEARRTVVVSLGSYSSAAIPLSHLCQFLGYSVTAELRGGPHLITSLIPLGPDDLVIGISFWRVYREVAQAVGWCTERGIPTVAITDSVYSPMAQAVSEAIVVPSEGTSFFQSTVAAVSVVQALVAELAAMDSHARQRIEMVEAKYEEFATIMP